MIKKREDVGHRLELEQITSRPLNCTIYNPGTDDRSFIAGSNMADVKLSIRPGTPNYSKESSFVNTLKHAATTYLKIVSICKVSSGKDMLTSSCNSLSLFRSTSCPITCDKFAPIACASPDFFPNGH